MSDVSILTGSNLSWDSKTVDKLITEYNLPSRRRKYSKASNLYDIAIALTPKQLNHFKNDRSMVNSGSTAKQNRPFFFSFPVKRQQADNPVANELAIGLETKRDLSTSNVNLNENENPNVDNDMVNDFDGTLEMELHLRQIQQNQERLQHRQARQASLQQQLQLQSQQIQKLVAQGSVLANDCKAVNQLDSHHGMDEVKPQVEAPTSNESLLDSISNTFWSFSKKVLSLAEDVRANESVKTMSPSDNDNDEFNADESSSARQPSGQDRQGSSVESQHAMTGDCRFVNQHMTNMTWARKA